MPNKRKTSIDQQAENSSVNYPTQRRSYSRDSYVSSAHSEETVEHSTSGVHGSHARTAVSENYSEALRKRKRNKKIKIAIISVLVIAALAVIGVVGYAWYLNHRITSGVSDEVREALTATEVTEPCYVLLMGVDKSQDRDESGEFDETYRCDTIILARLDPGNKQASLVSLPRDLMIENMGGTSTNPIGYGTQKLNAAYAFGGPALVVQTVAKIAGVNISHYVECDFDGFQAAVDCVGGVEIDVAREINDEHTGVYVPSGHQTLNGAEALSLCRSRHTYDDVGDGDALRTAYQRQVLSALASKLLSSDVATILNTVNTLVNYVTTDMDLSTILSYARSMAGMTSDKIYTASMPKTSAYIDDIWWDLTFEDQWKQMMTRMNQGLPPSAEAEVDEATGIVISTGGTATSTNDGDGNATSPAHATASIAVRNGTETTGIAAAAVERLKNFGYSDVDAGNANSSDYDQTIVVYNDVTYERDAEIIAAQLGCGQIVQNDGNYLMSGDLLVVLGSDYNNQS